VGRLTEGIATLGAAFYPKRVIVRLSDFKSNEYANLVGGERYEPEEENPMLGFRGAGRYVSDSFRDCFALECDAVKRVRNDMGPNGSVLFTCRDHQQIAGISAETDIRLGRFTDHQPIVLDGGEPAQTDITHVDAQPAPFQKFQFAFCERLAELPA
jgi:hypothetical protein